MTCSNIIEITVVISGIAHCCCRNLFPTPTPYTHRLLPNNDLYLRLPDPLHRPLIHTVSFPTKTFIYAYPIPYTDLLSTNPLPIHESLIHTNPFPTPTPHLNRFHLLHITLIYPFLCTDPSATPTRIYTGSFLRTDLLSTSTSCLHRHIIYTHPPCLHRSIISSRIILRVCNICSVL